MSVIDDNWDYHIDLHGLENSYYAEFECNTVSSQRKLFYLLDSGFQPKNMLINGNTTENQDALRDLIEKKKELRYEIEKKLEAISQQQVQYEQYKKEQKHLSQEIKEKHEAFLMAKKYYKKFLKMYFTIESRTGDTQIIFVQFFTETKKDSESYIVRLQRATKSGQYLILSTTPNIPNLKELQRTLEETNDVPGALCSIRQAFADIKNKNK